MKSNYIFIFAFLITLFACKSTKISQSEIEAFETLVENKNYRIESDMAHPQVSNAMQQVLNSGILQGGSSANAISLIGNSNFLTVSGDSITSYLPYFGERQMNIDYSGEDSGIQLKGLLENYKAIKGKNNSYNISFGAKSRSESFKVFITLYPNLKSNLQINGSGRFPISYSGQVEALKIE
ncbi:DUF4251 domain-containing protein [Algibacter sp. R77976]|uniref:DUF4251 domain-containing protein n=1 Tax=Algibacter sp. R77976 TaxID=3093873 RepID=UPI0037CB7F44